MRLPARHLACLFVLGFCATLAAQEAKQSVSAPTPRPASAATPAPVFTDSQVIEAWGWLIAQEKNLAGIEISNAELDAFLKGVAAGFKGQSAAYDLDKIFPDVERVARARREKVVRAITERNQAEAKTFLAGIEKDTNVVKLPSGLRYQIIKPGSGPCPKPQQTVNVHYLGHLLDGTEFIEFGPIDMVLWTNRFGSYLFEGLQKINPGGSIKLYVPSPSSEREVALYGIPPGSAMVFEVELLDLKNTSPRELEDTLLPPPPEVEPPPPSGFSEPQILETWGWSIARETRISNLGLGEAELSRLVKGLTAGVKGQLPPSDLKKIYPDVEKFINDRREHARLGLKEKQAAEMEALFVRLKQNTNVVVLPSGLRYEIIKPGSGPYPKSGKAVKITHVGRLLNGKVFDQTENDESIDIWICDNPPPWMIRGWVEGLQKINKGGRIKLYVPPSLGYGDQFIHNVPPYSTLIFEIEVLDIQDMPPPDDAATAPAEAAGGGRGSNVR